MTKEYDIVTNCQSKILIFLKETKSSAHSSNIEEILKIKSKTKLMF